MHHALNCVIAGPADKDLSLVKKIVIRMPHWSVLRQREPRLLGKDAARRIAAISSGDKTSASGQNNRG